MPRQPFGAGFQPQQQREPHVHQRNPSLLEPGHERPGARRKLKACDKVRDLIALGKEHGYSIVEDLLYPPNEPQFSEAQLSPKMAKALLRA